MTDLLQELRERVHGYWTDAPVPENENPKHRIVRETCELAREKGLTEQDIEDWAQLQQWQPTVAVVNATQLLELQTRLNRPGGVLRFRARLERNRRAVQRGE